MDFGPIEEHSAGRNAEVVKAVVQRLPMLTQSRSLTVSTTSFPTDLSDVRRDATLEVRREDWRTHLLLRSSQTSPAVGFSDYAIQHPKVVELDPRIISVSTQLRVTQKDSWLLIKGRSTKAAGFEYIRKVCSKAVEMAKPTPNAGFCWGDEFILECAQGSGKTGNATTWREVGFNRHFAMVLSQLGDF